ncbi:MAG: hypothetical protein AAF639_00145 [Chloroflexota bacterium]
MTIVVASLQEDTILLPRWLIKLLNLREGQKITPSVDRHSLKLTPLEEFLSLRGVFRDDDAFDEAIEELNQGWKNWTMQPSV